MSDETKRDPWLLVLMKGQVLNGSAEALGKGPWWLLALVLLATTMLAAFPFVNDKFTTALRSTDPALYPGLEAVFDEILARQWDLAVETSRLTTGPGVPAQARVGDWLVVFEPAAGSSACQNVFVSTLNVRV